MKTRSLWWIPMAVAIGLGAWLVPWRGRETRGQEPKARTLATLAEERVRLAKAAIKSWEAEGEKRPEQQREITGWLRRVAETRHELGGEKGEVIADLRAYVDRMREQVVELEAMQEAKVPLPIDLDAARYELLEAETWLAQAGG